MCLGTMDTGSSRAWPKPGGGSSAVWRTLLQLDALSGSRRGPRAGGHAVTRGNAVSQASMCPRATQAAQARCPQQVVATGKRFHTPKSGGCPG